MSSEAVRDLLDEVRLVPAIVEGKRDRLSLERLGFTAIIELDRPLFAVVERFGPGDAVQILTDLDAEGRRLYGRLYSDLTERGVRVDNRLREALFDTDLTHIEGFARWLERQS